MYTYIYIYIYIAPERKPDDEDERRHEERDEQREDDQEQRGELRDNTPPQQHRDAAARRLQGMGAVGFAMGVFLADKCNTEGGGPCT